MKKLSILYIFIIIFLGGCVNNTKCNLDTIEKSLTQEEKKELYAKIQFEINNLIDDADTYYAKTYYLKALETYKLINFYNDKNTISPSTINNIQKRIDANKIHYYTKAVSPKYANDKMKQLFYLNELMRNDPDYKNGKELYLALREDKDVEKNLQKEKETLEILLEKDSNEQEYILELNTIVNNITLYDDMEPLVLQGKKILKQKRYLLHDEAIKLYDEGKVTLANNTFNFIKSIYVKDKTSEHYLQLINKNNTLNTMEHEAIAALEESNYQEALNIANQILSYNNNNSKALDIFNKANLELKKQIPLMIKKATLLYSKQDYEKALNKFQEILKLDSRNDTALTFTKKIKAQLRTIKSLKTN